MQEPVLTVILVAFASAAATVTFFGAITVVVRNSLFPRLSNVTEHEYAPSYFGRLD